MTKPEWAYGFLAIVGSVIMGLVNPGFSLVISNVVYIYYGTSNHHMKQEIDKFILIVISLGVAALIGSFLQHTFFGVMGENLVKRIREMMFARRFSLYPASTADALRTFRTRAHNTQVLCCVLSNCMGVGV